MEGQPVHLKTTCTTGASVAQYQPGGWRMEIPAGAKGKYHLAQLDDYTHLRRRNYPWTTPLQLKLRARASSRTVPGTWGFGFWNDPFGMAIIRGVELVRLPALPNCAWFFFASPENYLSLRNDLPASGALAATFRSPLIPTSLLLLGAPFLPFALLRPGMRLLRRIGRKIVRQSAVRMEHDPTEWHEYAIVWRKDLTVLQVDGESVLETPVSPRGRMGLVMWIDNQYAAIRPEGSLGFGTLPHEVSWVEFEDLIII